MKTRYDATRMACARRTEMAAKAMLDYARYELTCYLATQAAGEYLQCALASMGVCPRARLPLKGLVRDLEKSGVGKSRIDEDLADRLSRYGARAQRQIAGSGRRESLLREDDARQCLFLLKRVVVATLEASPVDDGSHPHKV